MDFIIPIIVMVSLGIIFGILIAVCSKAFHVEEDKTLLQLTEMMPGYNCGACGRSGCKALAQAILDGDGMVNDCKPMKSDQRVVVENFVKKIKEKEDK